MKDQYRNNAKGRKRAKWLVLGIAGLLGALAGVAMFHDEIGARIGVINPFSGGEDPIPVLILEKAPFQLQVQAGGEVVGLNSVPVVTPGTGAGALKLAWMIGEGSMVSEGSPVVRFDSADQLLNLESQSNALSQNLLQTSIDSGNQQFEEKDLGLENAAAEIDYSYAMSVLPDDETIFSQWEIINARLDAEFAKAKIENLAARLDVQKQMNLSQQQVLAIARNQVQTEVDIIRRTLSALEVKAPASGLVVYRRDRRRDPAIGDSCQAGQVLIDLVDLNALQARIYVLERDAGGLATGKGVILKLDGLPGKELHGEVRTVSALAATVERNSPLKYFICDVTIRDAGLYLRSIRPGMTLQARVVLETYDSCFVVPASALDVKDAKTYVYVKQGDDFVKREVQVGLGTHGQATILGGVDEKEQVALKNPFETRQLKLPDFTRSTAIVEQGRGVGPAGGGRGR